MCVLYDVCSQKRCPVNTTATRYWSMRAQSLAQTLACATAAAAIATYWSQPSRHTNHLDAAAAIELLLQVALAAFIGCLTIFLLTPHPPAATAVSEDQFRLLTPPPPPSASSTTLYTDLVKRALINIIYYEQSYQIVLSRGSLRSSPVLAGPSFSLRDRVAGEDVSLNTLSMIGLARLDSLQACVEAVLHERVEGDLIEAGAAKAGACILMRAVLRANKDRTRRVFCCDTFSEGRRRPPNQALLLLLRPIFSLLALLSRFPMRRWQRRLYALLMRLQHSFPIDPAHVSEDTLDSFLFFLQSGARFQRPVVPPTGTGLDSVRSHFARFGLLDEQVVFLKGFFADTLPDSQSERFSLLRLDGVLYSSTMDALKHLYPKLSRNGFCIVDDYHSFEECKRAVDEYRSQHGISAPLVRVDAGSVFWRRAC